MTSLTKSLAGSAAMLAMIAATPTMARDNDRGGISTGEAVAGAVVLGGLVALAASAGDGPDYRYDRAGYGGYRGNFPDRAIRRCARAAEFEARRYGRFVNVTDIRDVDRTRFGFRVKGRIAVEGGRGRGWIDNGRFNCRIEGGRVVGLRLSGLGNYR